MNVANAGITLLALGMLLRHRQRRRRQTVNPSEQWHSHLAIVETLSHAVPLIYPLQPEAPPPLDACPCIFVDTPEALAEAALALSTAARVALDVEHHSQHTYFGQTCLLQLSTGTVDYLIDGIALKDHVAAGLGQAVLTNPAILKVVHGGGSDVVWLLRDFGVRLINIFDTEKAAQSLGMGQRSLQHLLSLYCGVSDMDKTHQMADWRQRPLPAELAHYARSDVHWLLQLCDLMGQELLRHGGDGCQLPSELASDTPLGRTVHRSQALSLSEPTATLPQVAASAAAAGIMKAHLLQTASVLAPTLASDEGEVEAVLQLGNRVHALCAWRDAEARRLDDAPRCVLPDAALLALAKGQKLEELERCGEFKDSCRGASAAVCGRDAIAAALNSSAAWSHPEVLNAVRPPGALEKTAHRKREDPEAFRERLGERFGVKKKEVYENCRMFSQEGELLCFTDKKRLLWYLAKGLAEEVDPGAEPLAVRLKFKHRDADQKRGAHKFYSAARKNRCVSCGLERHYLRHRIVPVCYRQALPVALKSHRSHDVVLLCVDCHEKAQRAAERTKREIAAEFGIPLFPPHPAVAAEEAQEEANLKWSPVVVSKAAIALHRSAAKMPAARRQELEREVSQFVRASEPWLRHLGADGAPFSAEELWAGLLAGVGRVKRKKIIRGWVEQGLEGIPAPLLEELAGHSAAEQGGSSEHREEAAEGEPNAEEAVAGQGQRAWAGHAWHGQKVVETVAAAGGDEALTELCARFRRSFVGLGPRFLPEGWQVNHLAPRAFGSKSVYS